MVAARRDSVAELLTHQSQQDRQLLCREERAEPVQGRASEHSDPECFTTIVNYYNKLFYYFRVWFN